MTIKFKTFCCKDFFAKYCSNYPNYSNCKTTLTISKSDGIDTVKAGQADTYTIVIKNTGAYTAYNVSVVDQLPSQNFLDSKSGTLPAGVTYDSLSHTWNIGTLAPGASKTLTIMGTVPPNATGDLYINKATVSASNAHSVSATDINCLVKETTLSISKSDDVSSIKPGEDTTYKIVITNTGFSTANNVVVKDILPTQGLLDISTPATLPAGVTFNAATQTWQIASLAPGESRTLEISGKIPPDARGNDYTNKVVATADGTRSVEASDTNCLTPEAKLQLSKTDGHDIATPGALNIYTIVVTNTGASTATNVIVSDSLPTQGLLDIQSVNLPDGVTFNAATQTWHIASLAPGASQTLQLQGTIPADARGNEYTNTVTAHADEAAQVSASDTNCLVPDVQLAITKTDGQVNLIPGQVNTYTIVITNTGTSTATNVIVDDVLPAQGLLNISSPNLPAGITFDAATETWSIPSLAPGQSQTLQISGTVPADARGNEYTNSVTAHANEAAQVSASDTDCLTPQAMLSITKTDGQVNLIPGQVNTYTIVITNTGTSTATNVIVDDVLPAQGLLNISSPNLPAGITFDAATETWSIPSLAPGQSQTLQISGTVPADARGNEYTNSVTAHANEAAQVSASDTDCLTPQAMLSITKTDGQVNLIPGQVNTYTIVITNTGTSTATNVIVDDVLPAQGLLNISSPNLPAGITFDAATETWSIPSLAPGQSQTLQISGTVPADARGNEYTNSVTAHANEAAQVSASDTDCLTPQAMLSITKTDGQVNLIPGQVNTYTIVITNTGTSTATNVIVDDVLPAQGLLNISSPNLPAGITFDAATETWSIPSLAPGQSQTLQISGTVPADARGNEYTNSVTAHANEAAQVSASDTDCLTPQAMLSITKTDGQVNLIPGQVNTYTIVITNTGTSTATNVIVDDVLPAQGLLNISSPNLPAGITFDAATETWSIPSLAPGQSQTLQISGTVPADARGNEYTNSVTAHANEAAQVSASDTDCLTPQAMLSITKTDGSDSVKAGDIGHTYTIVVQNTGLSTATNVIVDDVVPLQGLLNVSSPNLPAGVTFDVATQTWHMDSLAPGASQTLVIKGNIPSDATGSTYTNKVTAIADELTHKVEAVDINKLLVTPTLPDPCPPNPCVPNPCPPVHCAPTPPPICPPNPCAPLPQPQHGHGGGFGGGHGNAFLNLHSVLFNNSQNGHGQNSHSNNNSHNNSHNDAGHNASNIPHMSYDALESILQQAGIHNVVGHH